MSAEALCPCVHGCSVQEKKKKKKKSSDPFIHGGERAGWTFMNDDRNQLNPEIEGFGQFKH